MRNLRRPPVVSLLAIGALIVSGVAASPKARGAADENSAPRLIRKSRVAPVYPIDAWAARIPGQVALEAEILRDGTVGEIRVIGVSDVDLGFEQAARDAVLQWRFEPARKARAPVDALKVIRVSFDPPMQPFVEWEPALRSHWTAGPGTVGGGRASPGRLRSGGDSSSALSDPRDRRPTAYERPPEASQKFPTIYPALNPAAPKFVPLPVVAPKK